MAFEDLSDKWVCPVCGAPKEKFALVPSPPSPPSPGPGDLVCSVCDHKYDADEDGEGMAFEDLPDSWHCPVCGAPKSAFKSSGGADTSTTYTALVWVHRCGVLLSWGLLFPLGVSLVRFHPSGGRLRLHRTVQMFGLLVDTIQFGCIIAAHQVGRNGEGPTDGNFAASQGVAPTKSHKQIGLILYCCVIVQLVLGVCRPLPYPNNLKRRLWIWGHRAIGDSSLVLAAVQIWQGIMTVTDRNAFLALVIAASLFMASAALVVPAYLLVRQSSEAADAQSDAPVSAVASLLSRRPTADLDAKDDQLRNTMFHGCGHCSQVFTSKEILEVHIKFVHPGSDFAEILTHMPQRFAEISSMPEVTEGVKLSEVAKHNTRNDCWVVLMGKVYDLTAFLDKHPGGPHPILSWAGRDATKMWKLIHQLAWIDRYKEAICLGPVAPEDPEGIRPRPNASTSSAGREELEK